jgi:valyl-tRNA synthetase
MSDAFEQYDYATAREALEKFFWQTLCDNYIEIVKQRFWEPEKHDPSVIASSQATLYEALRRVLSLFAPFLPFVTEGLYQRVFKSYEDDVSLHVSSWPEFNESAIDEKAEAQLKLVLNILHTVRALRTQAKVSQNQRIKTLTLDIANDDLKSDIKVLEPLIASATLAENIGYDVAGNETDQEGLKLDIQLEIKEAS